METKVKFVLLAGVSAVAVLGLTLGLTVGLKSYHEDSDDEVLDKAPVIDGHNDLPWTLRRNYGNKFSKVNLFDELEYHTDIPRLRKGKVGGQFWSCYVPCGFNDSVRMGLEQVDVIKRMVINYPDTFMFAKTVADIEESFRQGKIASLIGMEGGHMIDSSMGALRMFYELGVRYMTLTHSCDTPWADGWNGGFYHEGLTDFGKKIIGEMNRLGMLIDLAHVSDATMRDAITTSSAPIIFSHSSAYGVCDSKRNVPDDVLQMTKENNGIVMVNFYNYYITCDKVANTSDVADHYDYIKSKIGVDNIGIGADYNGVGYTPEGLEDVSKYPNLIQELQSRGWSSEELMKITSGNILRVLGDVERVAHDLQRTDPSGDESWIPVEDVQEQSCRTVEDYSDVRRVPTRKEILRELD